MKILHVAPINVAGVPFSMMQMQRQFGHEARLVTLHENALTFPEDICLRLALPRSSIAHRWRDYKRQSSDKSKPGSVMKPRNIVERAFFRYDDWRRRDPIAAVIKKYNLDSFEVIHFDGGVDFFRDGRIATKWKNEGKKIVCHYMGSDLRVRGVHPVLNELSDLNLTNESDHLHLHPDIHYVYIPFDASEFSPRLRENKRLRIIHSPSNRTMKGTHLILPVIEELRKQRDVEFLLVENTPHKELLQIKESCDIAIEQVGNFGGTGYGRNSLETLALGIPTVTEMTADYLEWIPENPFVLATPETLLTRLLEIVDDSDLRRRKAEEGRTWVERYHSFSSVNNRVEELYRSHGIV